MKIADCSLARDLAFCGGNCETVEPSLPAQVEGLFPNASKFLAVIVPEAGHALNLVCILLDITMRVVLINSSIFRVRQHTQPSLTFSTR